MLGRKASITEWRKMCTTWPTSAAIENAAKLESANRLAATHWSACARSANSAFDSADRRGVAELLGEGGALEPRPAQAVPRRT